MESVNQTIRDKMIKHQVGLLRLSDDITAKLVTLLNRTEDDLMSQLSKKLENERLNAVLAGVRNTLDAARSGEYEMMQKELTNLAEYEPKFVKNLIEGQIPVKFDMATPSTDMLSSIVTTQPFQGKLLKEWVYELSDSRRKLIRDAVRMGMVEGQAINEIVKRIRGTKANQYKDGLMEISRRGAQAMTRTAVNHTASLARQQMYEKNTDIIGSEQFSATLDGRTTPLCRALDGKKYPVGKAPVPGRDTHIGCRSTIIPVVKTWRELGIDIDEAPESTRASFDGQVPESTTYNEWLKGQDPKFQDSILGPGRGELFRQGVPVDKFVDLESGRSFTLKELAQMDGVKGPLIKENLENVIEKTVLNNRQASAFSYIDSMSGQAFKKQLASNVYNEQQLSEISNITEQIKNGDLPICMNRGFHKKEILEQFIEDGNFKNQFETQTSKGCLDFSKGGQRDQWEERLYNGAFQKQKAYTDILDSDTLLAEVGKERPRYGYLSDPNSPFINNSYGDLTFVFKPQAVADRCTFSIGNSSGIIQKDIDRGRVFTADAPAALWREWKLVGKPLEDSVISGKQVPAGFSASSRYTEVQFLGDVSLNDVAEIIAPKHFEDPEYDYDGRGALLRKLSKKWGIPIRYVRK